jgi:hypothetical protein
MPAGKQSRDCICNRLAARSHPRCHRSSPCLFQLTGPRLVSSDESLNHQMIIAAFTLIDAAMRWRWFNGFAPATHRSRT